MRKLFFSIISLVVVIGSCYAQNNQLSDEEKKEGWKLLFNGTNLTGWHTYNQKTVGPSWRVENGTIFRDTLAAKSENADLCTDEEFENFDLKYQWKISKNGNSGVMFLVHESPEYKTAYLTGPEMQVLDNEGHPDGKLHKHRTGDLYDLIASSSEPVHPVGEWNEAEIRLDHGKLTLYLNGVQTVSTTLWDKQWDELVKGSKFANWPGFAKYKTGHIDLQDHGFDVWFRDIKLKKL